jgi:hypothetical protein
MYFGSGHEAVARRCQDARLVIPAGSVFTFARSVPQAEINLGRLIFVGVQVVAWSRVPDFDFWKRMSSQKTSMWKMDPIVQQLRTFFCHENHVADCCSCDAVDKEIGVDFKRHAGFHAARLRWFAVG